MVSKQSTSAEIRVKVDGIKTVYDRKGGSHMEPQRLLVSPQEAGQALGIGQTKVYELLRIGDLRSIKVGRLRKIPVSELHRFVGTRFQGDEPVKAQRMPEPYPTPDGAHIPGSGGEL